jgi:plasmid stabilization system protein ParE
MRVRYTRQAVADLLAIADYIAERNPAAAARAETAIRSTIDLLADFPRLGRDRPELDARALGIPRWPYTPYYRIENEEIWIVHIRDGRRPPVEPGDLG